MAIVTRDPLNHRPLLVSDFDGTMTRIDFYRRLRDCLLPPDFPDEWAEYRAGRITHFEALRRIFAAIAPGEAALLDLTRGMELDPGLATSLNALRAGGWDVIVVSAGCAWYIDHLLAKAGVALDVVANPGHISDGRLIMEKPIGSPYYSEETGVDKAKVVTTALEAGRTVAFAGDGPPDLAPALLVPPQLRFARADLAGLLERRGEPFLPFECWSDVARTLCQRDVRE